MSISNQVNLIVQSEYSINPKHIKLATIHQLDDSQEDATPKLTRK